MKTAERDIPAQINPQQCGARSPSAVCEKCQLMLTSESTVTSLKAPLPKLIDMKKNICYNTLRTLNLI